MQKVEGSNPFSRFPPKSLHLAIGQRRGRSRDLDSMGAPAD
jgi:hypothetical protein